MRNRVILSLALIFLVAPLAFAGQDAKATNAADGQVTELALAQSQPQVVMVGMLPPSSVGDCVSRCERRRQLIFQSCLRLGVLPPRVCARGANLFARRCKDRCRDDEPSCGPT